MICKNCSKKISKRAVYCEFCGHKIASSNIGDDKKSAKNFRGIYIAILIISLMALIPLGIGFYQANMSDDNEQTIKSCHESSQEKASDEWHSAFPWDDYGKYNETHYERYYSDCLREHGVN